MAGVYPPTETLAVGSAQTELCSAALNVQKHCPPYTKDLLISGLPQTLDALLLPSVLPPVLYLLPSAFCKIKPSIEKKFDGCLDRE